MNNNTSVLYHHGIKGQKHGVRRFQYPDGSLTPAGVARYRKGKRRNTSVNKNVSNNKPKNHTSETKKSETAIDKLKNGYDKCWDLLESTIGTTNLRVAKNSLATASAALWLAAEIAPMSRIPMSSLAAVTNAVAIILDPDN